MNRTHLILLSMSLALGTLACRRDAAPQATEAAPQAAAQAPQAVGSTASGVVLETMDASNYTYVRFKAPSGELWAAGPQTQVAVGDKIEVSLEMPMAQFHSATLNRTFPTIYFTSRIVKEPVTH